MGIFSKIFNRKPREEKAGGMQDYMTLVRVYFQASLAAQLGITNLAMLQTCACSSRRSTCPPRTTSSEWARGRIAAR